MIEMLEKGEADIALTVADATIVARNNHRQIQIAGCWVPSPLVWAIATTPNNSRYRDMKQFWDHQQNSGVNHLRVGISRPGSGSQTMASYMAMLNDIKVSSTASNLCFSAANNFVGLRNGVNNDGFDLFLWETFTTKPFFDSGELYKVTNSLPCDPLPFSYFFLILGSLEMWKLLGQPLYLQLIPIKIFNYLMPFESDYFLLYMKVLNSS